MKRRVRLFRASAAGARSRRAVGLLRRMGYTRVKSIGGISGYKGAVEGKPKG